jgi:hypothetical protein
MTMSSAKLKELSEALEAGTPESFKTAWDMVTGAPGRLYETMRDYYSPPPTESRTRAEYEIMRPAFEAKHQSMAHPMAEEEAKWLMHSSPLYERSPVNQSMAPMNMSSRVR